MRHPHEELSRPGSTARLHCNRSHWGSLLTILLAMAPPLAAAAVSTAPPATVPAANALSPPAPADADRMDEAFREGVRLYELREYTAAARTWQEPAAQGHIGAQFSLGVAYATGNGVTQNLDHAIQWWQAAATYGHTSAQLNLGLLYWRGEGVEKDLTKARQWWRRAADGGDPAAQFHLGAMAAVGEGVPRDYEEAARWWRRAAAQGYRQAIKGLEILKGSGVPVDATY